MRINIYIPTRELHDSIKAEAGKCGKSVSAYLIHLHLCQPPAFTSEELALTPENCVHNSEEREPLNAPSKSVQRRLSVQKSIKCGDVELVANTTGKGYYPPRPKGQDGKK